METIGQPLDELVSRSEIANKQVISWFKNVPSLRLQIIISIINILIMVFSLNLISSSGLAPFQIHTAYYIALGFIGFSLPQGVIWGLLTPTSINQIYKIKSNELFAYRLNPSQTPIIIALSRVLSNYALDFAIVTTICLLAVIALKPTNATTTIGLFIVLFVGYLVSSYTFFRSQYLLSIIIRREKDYSIDQINIELNRYWNRLGKLDKASFEKMNNLIHLVSVVQSTKNTAIDLSSTRSYFSSLIIPTITYAAGVIDWAQVLKYFFKP